MLLTSIYTLLRLHISLLLIGTRSSAELALEVIALRHEVALLRRQLKRPHLTNIDRMIFAGFSRYLPSVHFLFSTATLLRWHRDLVRRRWAAFGLRPRRPGRPQLAAEVRDLVVKLARENVRWGYLRLRGELLGLGHDVSAASIRRILRQRRVGPAPRRIGPTWREFLRAQAGSIIACDYLTVDTVFLGTLYVLVCLELRSRAVIWWACSAHPDSAWVTQQGRNLVCEIEDLGIKAKFTIHDRDGKFSGDFDRALRARGIRPILTPYRSPRANAYIERALGSLRRECLDWLLIVGERQLQHILNEFFEHYNRARPHRALALRPPRPEPDSASGEIICTQRLGGLINEYSHAA